jgi:lipopolysaccharide/colanic/teichoic acid biosynthesis glycosyltransferase
MDQGSARLRWSDGAALNGPTEVGEGDEEAAGRRARSQGGRPGRARDREGLLTRRLDGVARRALDIVVAAMVLVLAAPALLVIALAIVIESPGPVFYRAERIGRRGHRLRMLKFRKMWPDAEGRALTADADLRLTKVGAVLAKSRLDEMPQLWHVLRGQMSLVGPRPEDPNFVAEHAAAYREILNVRPGLTGFAQLAFAEERRILSVADPVADYLGRILPAKCRLDLLYVRELSLWTNVRVMTWTAITLVLRRPVAVNRSTGRLGVRRRPAPAHALPPRPLGPRGLTATLEPSPAVAAADRPGAAEIIARSTAGAEDLRRLRVLPRWWSGGLSRGLRRRGMTRRARRRAQMDESSRSELGNLTDAVGTTEGAHTEVSHEGRGTGRRSGDAFASIHDRDSEAAGSGR